MAIPKTRDELIDQVTLSYENLSTDLDGGGPSLARLVCLDDWTVKDLLAVRAWWTHSVVDWIEAGARGETPVTPATGYTWKETPRLNSDIVKSAEKKPYRKVRAGLDEGIERVIATIDSLNDKELLQPGVFEWAGKWPVSRWISINTARQYSTARTYVRKAMREQTEEAQAEEAQAEEA